MKLWDFYSELIYLFSPDFSSSSSYKAYSMLFKLTEFKASPTLADRRPGKLISDEDFRLSEDFEESPFPESSSSRIVLELKRPLLRPPKPLLFVKSPELIPPNEEPISRAAFFSS